MFAATETRNLQLSECGKEREEVRDRKVGKRDEKREGGGSESERGMGRERKREI